MSTSGGAGAGPQAVVAPTSTVPPPTVVAPPTVVHSHTPAIVRVQNAQMAQMYRQQAWRRYVVVLIAVAMLVAGVVMLSTFNMGFGYGLIGIGVILVASHFIQCMMIRRRMASNGQVIVPPNAWVQSAPVPAAGPQPPGYYPPQPYMPPPPGGPPTQYPMQPPPYTEANDNPAYVPQTNPSFDPSAPPPSYSSVIEGDKQT